MYDCYTLILDKVIGNRNQYKLIMSTNNGTLVIEDDGDGIAEVSPARVIGDAEKLERLEKNLARAEEMRKVGMNDQADIETEHSDATNHGDSNTKKKRSKGKSAKEGETVFAPSIDEVTTDNDHLASLRGEGRYFGVVDPDVSQPVCSNCHRRGHRRAQCKVVVCHACGKVDDHYETQCPNSMVCSNCGQKGHFRNNCPSKRMQTYCVECDSRNHSSDRCPYIWRSYLVKPKDRKTKMAYPTNQIFCYNCAEKGHYGDDCKQLRVSKTPNINGSAFSGANLPKELISQYNDTQNRNSGNNNNRKRNYDTANNVNYNYAPPPYPRYNNYNNNNGNRSGNNNNYKNRNYNNNKYKNSNLPSGPTKSGYLANKNNYGNQGRNNNYSNSNYNNQRNSNSYNSRSSYFNSRRY